MGQRYFPKGRIALGGGDLIDVVNVKYTHTNNAKQVHTLRESGAGITMGVEESTVSYDTVVGAEGVERDYFQLVKTGKIVQVRIKVPGETITVEGAYTTRDFELPLDDSVKLSMSFVGHTVG